MGLVALDSVVGLRVITNGKKPYQARILHISTSTGFRSNRPWVCVVNLTPTFTNEPSVTMLNRITTFALLLSGALSVSAGMYAEPVVHLDAKSFKTVMSSEHAAVGNPKNSFGHTRALHH